MTVHSEDTTTQRLFLIVIQDPLIREDLRQAVVEATPDATFLLADTIGAAMAVLDTSKPVVAAFIGVDLAEFAASPLAHNLERWHGQVVLTEPWDSSLPMNRDWLVLPFPFTSHAVFEVIEHMVGVRPMPTNLHKASDAASYATPN